MLALFVGKDSFRVAILEANSTCNMFLISLSRLLLLLLPLQSHDEH
jgi:hypothetical protein